MGLLALLLLAGCSRNPAGRPTPASATSLPSETLTAVAVSVETPASVSPSATPTAAVTDTPTTQPFTEEDVTSALDVVQDFLGKLSSGEYRVAYGRLLTTGGQEKLAELVLGRLALNNPRISYFELLGAEPVRRSRGCGRSLARNNRRSGRPGNSAGACAGSSPERCTSGR